MVHTKYKKYFLTLRNALHAMNEQLDPDQVMEAIMNYVEKLIPSEGWSILLIDEHNNDLIFERAFGAVGDKLKHKRLKIGTGIAGWVVQTAKPIIINNTQKDKRFNAYFDKQTNFMTKTMLCAPIISRNKVLGAVEIINKRGTNQQFSRADLRLLETLLEPAGIALENALLFRQIQRLLITDDLTQLYNFRYVNQCLENAIRDYQMRKNKKQICLIFLDLDGFKEIDDKYGHLIGGEALKVIGQVIKDTSQADAIVARYGGDEFTIILMDTEAPQALAAAECIRKAIASIDFSTALNITAKVTASIGVALYPDHATSTVELIHKADQVMYLVKYSGKNAVRLA
jgi:diguanylate cyclase (GGDEF)-like protein